ncbi:hypothetical protein SAMD00019534_077290 [Acytostelium subglobosum LB1]|uniref:hypothetical protein n=1 Tax=Acytostelium subglobosum LB1 TaxID=1410327 RepID=UPI000644A6F1|nr:hypothetical protein SAMD00019534_077290 [Acytostelium subglobosum LB1]GAM24554.1 hypothetical protein SAMD00019534_077290 [Acytostelium subglobosum LB1]|eukprot:XP_012752223.1 hypothetical protein SAMD00019534_077290 [Acytostelium subglobosum LB1]
MMGGPPMSMSQLYATSATTSTPLGSQYQPQQQQQQQQPLQLPQPIQYIGQQQQQSPIQQTTRYLYTTTPSPPHISSPMSQFGASGISPLSVNEPSNYYTETSLVPMPSQQQQQQDIHSTSMMIPSSIVRQQQPLQQQHQQQVSTTTVTNNINTFSKDVEMQLIFKNSVGILDEVIANVDLLQDPTKTLDSAPVTGYNYFETTNQVWNTMVLEKHVQFPQEVTQRYLTANTKTLQGIFPEIGRAWISIDQTLFLWDYKDTGDLITNHLSQIITACGLVTPRKNVFKDCVRHVLVVATHVEIFLFALAYDEDGKFELITTPLVVPTDSVIINDIVGTDDGRIFVGGQDGNLYEIAYSDGSASWFRSSKISKINHTSSMWSIWSSKRAEIIQIQYDVSRRMLFTLDKSSTIHRYTLLKNKDHGLKAEQPLTPLVSKSEPRLSILSIHLSSQSEYQIVAICSDGIRRYISDTTGASRYARRPPVLVHPHYSFYCNGVYFVAAEAGEHMDNLYGVTPFSRKMIKKLYEVDNQGFVTSSNEDSLEERPNLFKIKGRVNVIKEDCVNTGKQPTVFYKEFKNEHTTVPRRFLCLNSLGMHIIAKLRYVDTLHNLLASGSATDIDAFYNEFGPIYSNSLCIALYCETPQSAPILADQFYGTVSAPRSAPLRIADIAMSQFKRRAGKPSYLQAKTLFSQDMGASVNKSEIAYSYAHNAVVAYLSRVLSPLWSHPMIDSNSSQCRWSVIQLKILQSHLANLLLFLENSQLVPKTSDNDIPITRKPINEQSTDDDALKNEKRSLLGIKRLVVKSIQVTNLFLIMLQFNFQQIFEGMDGLKSDDRLRIYQFKFRDYVTDQTELATDPTKNVPSLLIASCMKLLNSLNIQIDGVTRQLEYECPDLFKKNDKLLLIAKDKLKIAIRDRGVHTDSLVTDALLILDEVSPFFDLAEMIGYLVSLQKFGFIVPLALTFAGRLDPNNVTQQDPSQQQLSASKQAELAQKVELKKKALFEMFNVINQIVNDQSHYPTTVIDHLIEQILNCDDRVAHELLYHWLLSNGLKGRLFEVNSTFISDFLLEHDIDLCWKHHAKNGDKDTAARIIIELAEKSKLNDKITCYTNCTLLMNEHKESEVYLYAKRQLMLCGLQKKIINSLTGILKSSNNNNNNLDEEIHNKISVAIQTLDDNAFDLTTLFKDYARPYFLHEEMLYIVHYGNHDDQQFVKNIWKIIIENEANQELYRDVNQMLEALRNKIVNIGYDLHPKDSTFPVQSIINIAEKTAFLYGKQTGTTIDNPIWLAKALHNQVKIDYFTLLDQYKAIIEEQDTSIESNEVTWRQGEEQDHLILIFVALIESILREPLNSMDRHIISSKRITYTLKMLKERLSQSAKDTSSRIDQQIDKVNGLHRSVHM